MSREPDDYFHPQSGRAYRQGDPAHRFAQLTHALVRQAEEMGRYGARLTEMDYLTQTEAWLGDCDRIARAMRSTIEAIDAARTELIVDRDAYRYGLGQQDDEWQRKYGTPEPIPDGGA